jgi:hypothetical protein
MVCHRCEIAADIYDRAGTEASRAAGAALHEKCRQSGGCTCQHDARTDRVVHEPQERA